MRLTGIRLRIKSRRASVDDTRGLFGLVETGLVDESLESARELEFPFNSKTCFMIFSDSSVTPGLIVKTNIIPNPIAMAVVKK